VQAFDRSEMEQERFQGLTQRTIRASLRALLCQEQFKAATGGLTVAATAIVMSVGGFSVFHGNMTVGSLLVLIAYFGALFSPIEPLACLAAGLASAGAGARRVFDVIESSETTVVEIPAARPLPAVQNSRGRHLQVEGVTFGYEPDRAVLQNVTF